MTLYISNGKDENVIGPLDAFEVLQYIEGQDLKNGNWQICDESHVWKPLADQIATLATAKRTTSNVRHIIEGTETGTEKGKPKGNIQGFEDKIDLPASIERLGKVRQVFDAVWAKQRERVVAMVKNREPDDNLTITAKEHKALKEQLNSLVIEYWRKSGVLIEWIKEITWGDPSEMGDCYFKLEGTDMDKKLEEAGKILEEKGFHDEPGCYCFMKGREYLYIGETHDTDGDQNLGKRILTGHKNKDWWEDTDGMRIIIPRNVKNAKKLERLLILAYSPKKNTADGQKSSAADDCIETIVSELEELTQT